MLTAGPQQRPRRRLAPVVTSVVAVLAIVLAGGGFAAYKALASKGGQPDKWAPANSLFYAKMDLDPAASTKVAAWEFEQKFPSAPKIASADDLKDALLESAFANQADVDYDADVKPWLGDRAAFAVFPDSAGKAQTIGILAVKDAGKAKESIAKLSGADHAGYSIQDSYVVLGESQPIVDEAVAAAKKANITGNSAYKDDTATLKGDRIVTGWWDAGQTAKSLGTALPGGAGALLGSSAVTGLPDLTSARLAFGLRVQPDYLELEGRTFGLKAPAAGAGSSKGQAAQALENLPGGTVAGLALADPGQLVKKELASLQSGLLGAGLQSQLDTIGAQLGISLPGDLENLLGSQLAVGLDAVPHGAVDQALVTLMTKPTDLARGAQTAKVLAATLSAQAGLSLTASTRGSAVVITNDDAAGAGRLTDNPTFKAALDGMPDDATIAGYVDIGAFVQARPGAPADASHLGGLGFYAGTQGGASVFAVRLTVK